MRSYTGSGLLALYDNPEFRDDLTRRLDLHMREVEEGVDKTSQSRFVDISDALIEKNVMAKSN